MRENLNVYVLKVGESPPGWYRTMGIQPLYRSDEERDKPIFYHFWCIKGEKETIVVDTGISPEEQGHVLHYESPRTLLSQIGVNAGDIEKVVITHLHPNHFSGFHLFENSEFYIQESEFRSLTQHVAQLRFMREKILPPPRMQEDLKDLSCVQRIHYLNGDEKIADGVTVHLLGGHTPGLQVVSIQTTAGTAVICSDLAYLYRGINEEIPVGTFWNLQQACEGLKKVKQLVNNEKMLFPSHDPLVWDGRYPLISPRIAKLA